MHLVKRAATSDDFREVNGHTASVRGVSVNDGKGILEYRLSLSDVCLGCCLVLFSAASIFTNLCNEPVTPFVMGKIFV